MKTQYEPYSILNVKVTTRILLSSLVFLYLCLLSMPGEAKKLYKYQDEKGRWHYTDKAPSALQSKEFKVEVRQLKVATKRRVQLNQIGKKQQPEFVIKEWE